MYSSVGLSSSSYLFTFHHVSIKTADDGVTVTDTTVFTFHHVSIKTGKRRFTDSYVQDLHSTMYLLKHTAENIMNYLKKIYIPPCIY